MSIFSGNETHIITLDDEHLHKDVEHSLNGGENMVVEMKKTQREAELVAARRAIEKVALITLGQVRTREKSNEITAIPELLDALDIRGATVTIDAMGCQTEIAKKIVAAQANYVLAVKQNQPSLYEAIAAYFTWAKKRSNRKTDLAAVQQL